MGYSMRIHFMSIRWQMYADFFFCGTKSNLNGLTKWNKLQVYMQFPAFQLSSRVIFKSEWTLEESKEDQAETVRTAVLMHWLERSPCDCSHGTSWWIKRHDVLLKFGLKNPANWKRPVRIVFGVSLFPSWIQINLVSVMHGLRMFFVKYFLGHWESKRRTKILSINVSKSEILRRERGSKKKYIKLNS